MAEARFSIIVTCHNQQDYIRKAVDSALAQGPNVREVIVVDDASTDGSLAILETYGDAIRLVCLSKNKGCIAARNEGAACAQGKYVVFLDGDDYLSPWTIGIYAQLIAETRAKIVIANPKEFSGAEPETSEHPPAKIRFVAYEKLIDKDRPHAIFPSFALEREMFERVGRWTPDIFELDLDDMCMKLAGEGPVAMVRAPETFHYRIHEANSIHAVPRFLEKLRLIIGKMRSGGYPGGASLRFRRNAWMGRVAKYWIREAWRQGMRKKAIALFVPAAVPVMCAALRRAIVYCTGRRSVERVAFDAAFSYAAYGAKRDENSARPELVK